MCSVNIALGREERLQHEKPERAPGPKKVFIIGGGPAGMEAARVAALRGHDVTLFEKRDKLGGALIEASIPKFKKDLVPLIDYLTTQVRKLGVKVYTQKEMNPQAIMRGSPEAIVIATGALPNIPNVPGIDKPHVAFGLDVLRGKQVGETVILIGGGLVSCELAWLLSDMGKKVIMTTRQAEIGQDVEMVHKAVLQKELAKAKVKVYNKVSLKEIVDEGVIVSGARQFNISGDSVIVMAGFSPNNELGQSLAKSGLKIVSVGDCVQPRGINEAIYEGHIAAWSL